MVEPREVQHVTPRKGQSTVREIASQQLSMSPTGRLVVVLSDRGRDGHRLRLREGTDFLGQGWPNQGRALRDKGLILWSYY